MSIATAPAAVDVSRALGIRGWMSERELQWLAGQAAESSVVVEVGSFAGRSARAMADALPAGGILYCVDPLDPTLSKTGLRRQPPDTSLHLPELRTREAADVVFAELRANLSDHIAAGRVVILRQPSVEGAATLRREIGVNRADFVFIDGDHAEAAVAADIEAWLPFVEGRGLLAGHDYYAAGPHQGVRRAVDRRFGERFERPAGSIWNVRP